MTITVRVPVPTAAATATRPSATRPAITMGAPRAAVTGAAVQSRDQALSTSVAMSNANGSGGRRWTYGYQSSADGYEEPPQPPAQVWDGGNNY